MAHRLSVLAQGFLKPRLERAFFSGPRPRPPAQQVHGTAQ
jgi:hypothetical protein